MRAPGLLARTALLAAVAWAVSTARAEGPDFDLKLRTGLTTMQKDMHDNKAFGVAVGATFPLWQSGALVVDFGYDYIPGRGWDALPDKTAKIWYSQNGTVISSGPNGSPLFVQVAQTNGSADSHKTGYEGFSARFAYLAPVAALKGLSWQAGLSLDRYKSSNQFVGNAVPVYMDGTTVKNLGSNAYEGWAISTNRSTLNAGVFAGLVYQVHENHKLELNIRNIGYGIQDFQPLAYTGRAAQLSDKNGRGFVFEFGLTVKL